MGSNKVPLKESVPIVNLSELRIGENGKEINLSSLSVEKVVKEIRSACAEWGFFYVVGHGIPLEQIERMRKVAAEFFYSPKSSRNLCKESRSNNFRGYTDNELTKQKLDWKEAFDFGFDVKKAKEIEEGRINLDPGKNQWPEDKPHFKETLIKYFSALHSLGTTLMDLIFMSFDVDPKTMRHHFNENSDTSFCRLNYYPVYPAHAISNGHLGVGPHSDSGVLTILLQDDNVSSLQVQKDGVFHNVTPIPGSYVINIGDMMQVWSNGQYKAPIHRVLTSSSERFSVPFFFNPAYETNVEPLSQCISKDQPRRYRPVNWGAFRQERIQGNYVDQGEEIQIYHFEIHN